MIPSNYRPVSNLPVLSRVLEKAVFNQLIKYLESNKLIHPNHHGGRKGHNTATALGQMLDQWVEEVERGKLVGVMMTDLSSAYKMVPVSVLREKLGIFGLDMQALQWMESFLVGRRQSTCIDGKLSQPKTLDQGSPQGSNLAPLLYVLFTADIPDLAHTHPVSFSSPSTYCKDCGSTVAYIDDNTYSTGCDTPTELSQKLSAEYQRIQNYMASKKLVLNDEKTSLLVFGNKSVSSGREQVVVQAGAHTITPSQSHVLLGATVGQNLKWDDHILRNKHSLMNQLRSRLNGLSLVCRYANFKTRLMVGQGIFLSKLCYLIQIWGGTSAQLIKNCQVMQNKAMQIITGMHWFTPTGVLLQKCKVIINQSPTYLYNKIHPESTHNTRHSVKFGENFTGKTERSQSSFCYRGVKLYNKIPLEITRVQNLQTFKAKLKTWIRINVTKE